MIARMHSIPVQFVKRYDNRQPVTRYKLTKASLVRLRVLCGRPPAYEDVESFDSLDEDLPAYIESVRSRPSEPLEASPAPLPPVIPTAAAFTFEEEYLPSHETQPLLPQASRLPRSSSTRIEPTRAIRQYHSHSGTTQSIEHSPPRHDRYTNRIDEEAWTHRSSRMWKINWSKVSKILAYTIALVTVAGATGLVGYGVWLVVYKTCAFLLARWLEIVHIVKSILRLVNPVWSTIVRGWNGVVDNIIHIGQSLRHVWGEIAGAWSKAVGAVKDVAGQIERVFSHLVKVVKMVLAKVMDLLGKS
jgi:hypothetical protein